jgi:hypothetical protein
VDENCVVAVVCQRAFIPIYHVNLNSVAQHYHVVEEAMNAAKLVVIPEIT